MACIHIIRLDDRARGEVLQFDAVLTQLRDAHDKSAWTRASRDVVTGLIAAADISGVDFGAAG